jgi:hypothetical protein
MNRGIASSGKETCPKLQLIKKFDLNVANFSATNLQICIWKKSDQSDTSHSKIILVSECYVFLQQFYKNAVESFKDNSLWRKKCVLDTHLYLYGKETGTIQGTFDLICQPFVQQKIAGVTTEDGIKMAAPLIHRGPSVNKHTKIADLAEQLEVLNDLFMKTDYTNPQSNHRQIEKQIKNSLKYINETLSSGDKKNTHIFTYTSAEELMRAQTVFLDIGLSFLEIYNILEKNLDQVFFSSYISLLKRGEFLLPNLMWDETTPSKLESGKQKIAVRYQKFLYMGLAKVFEGLNNTAMSNYQKKFIECYLAMSYFRIPEFRFKLITALGNKPYGPANEENEAKLYLFANWNRLLFDRVTIDKAQANESRTFLNASLEKPWLERLKSRGIFYFFFIKEIADYVFEKLQVGEIVWTEIPGYEILLNNFLGHMRSKEVTKYPDIMIEASLSLLRNVSLLDRFVMTLIERTR